MPLSHLLPTSHTCDLISIHIRRVSSHQSSMASASHFQLLLFVILSTINHLSTASQTPLSHTSFLLDITKDAQTHQYTTPLLIGTPPLPTNLILHLSGDSLVLNCGKSPSSSRHLLPHNSLPCSMAKSAQTPSPPTICTIPQQNPITRSTSSGNLAEDIVTIPNGMGPTPTVSINNFLFSCAHEHVLKGLAENSKGILGFGRSKIAFQSQAVNTFDSSRLFSMCLSTSDGFIVSGSSISKSLSYTPLISTNGDDDGYYLNLKSIKINGRRIVGQQQQVEISTVVPYTKMKSPMYGLFIKAYVMAASSMNMTMVDPVAPFGVCFRKERKVPEIELVLQSEMVKWRIERRNLMVEVSDGVMCLGFVDGGLEMRGSVVLGGFQLEDRVLEFNLGTGMMGFSNEGNSCSDIKRGLVSYSRPLESL